MVKWCDRSLTSLSNEKSHAGISTEREDNKHSFSRVQNPKPLSLPSRMIRPLINNLHDIKKASESNKIHAGFLHGFSSTLKIEVTWSSEISVNFQRTTWRYIPHDRTLLSYSNWKFLSRFQFLESSKLCNRKLHYFMTSVDKTSHTRS
jgi:hypothetical protein